MSGERMNGRIKRLLKNRSNVEANVAFSYELAEATDRERARDRFSFASDGKSSQFVGVALDPLKDPHWLVELDNSKADPHGKGIPCQFSDTNLEPLFHLWRTMVPEFGATASIREEGLPMAAKTWPQFALWQPSASQLLRLSLKQRQFVGAFRQDAMFYHRLLLNGLTFSTVAYDAEFKTSNSGISLEYKDNLNRTQLAFGRALGFIEHEALLGEDSVVLVHGDWFDVLEKHASGLHVVRTALRSSFLNSHPFQRANSIRPVHITFVPRVFHGRISTTTFFAVNTKPL